MNMTAQTFFNLTADEVKIDSVLPTFSLQQPLGPHYADSVYEVSIFYPEFREMSQADVARYQAITTEVRKQGVLNISFVPIVFREGKYQKLVSFKLDVKSTAMRHARRVGEVSSSRYVSQSVLATGRWAKIRVSETGVYQLTDALIRKAGFSNPSKVHIYGYGGALQPEKLTADYLSQTDDLKEVPTCTVDGRRLFYAVGPVNWDAASTVARTRNPYSDYGYYFLTEADDAPLSVDSAAFRASFYPSANDYHDLHEVDNYAWYHGGRNLYEATLLSTSSPRTITMPAIHGTSAKVDVNLSFDKMFEATLLLNGTMLGTLKPNTSVLTLSGTPRDGLALATQMTWTFDLPAEAMHHDTQNTFTLRLSSGSEVRVDWLSLRYDTPKSMPDLTSTSLPVPEYLYQITNQNHHADPQADMVIVIPTSQKFLSQAQRLKTLHEISVPPTNSITSSPAALPMPMPIAVI